MIVLIQGKYYDSRVFSLICEQQKLRKFVVRSILIMAILKSHEK